MAGNSQHKQTWFSARLSPSQATSTAQSDAVAPHHTTLDCAVQPALPDSPSVSEPAAVHKRTSPSTSCPGNADPQTGSNTGAVAPALPMQQSSPDRPLPQQQDPSKDEPNGAPQSSSCPRDSLAQAPPLLLSQADGLQRTDCAHPGAAAVQTISAAQAVDPERHVPPQAHLDQSSSEAVSGYRQGPPSSDAISTTQEVQAAGHSEEPAEPAGPSQDSGNQQGHGNAAPAQPGSSGQVQT